MLTRTKRNNGIQKGLKLLLNGSRYDFVGWLELLLVSVLAVIAWRYQLKLVYELPTNYFFWPILGPVLIALRYGFGRGLISLLLMIVMLSFWGVYSDIDTQLSLSVIAGSVLVTMVVGEFRDGWHHTNQRQRLSQEYAERRLELFTQSYHLLKVSHDQLEQRLAGKQVSLRTSVQAIRKFTLADGQLTAALAEQAMTVLSEVISLHQAGFYLVENEQLVKKPMGQRGRMAELIVSDPMIQDALERKLTVAVQDLAGKNAVMEFSSNRKLNYQLVIPFVDINDNIRAMIVAEQVRFVQLTQANIALIHLLASYIANLVSQEVLAPKLLPEQNKLFLRYLNSQKNYFTHFCVDSSFIVFVDRTKDQSLELERITEFRRGADVYWITKNNQGQFALVVLLPLTSLAEVERYMGRVESILLENSDYQQSDLEIFGPLLISQQHKQVHELLEQFGAFSENFADSDYHSR